MIKVAFAGAQDSGKTTMAMALASLLGSKDHITAYVPEYAREYIMQFGTPSSLAEQLTILARQLEYEAAIASKTELVFTDSPVFLSYIYALDVVSMSNPKDRHYLSSIYRKVICAIDYDLIFYLKRIRMTPRRDGVRTERSILHNAEYENMIVGFLDGHRLAYYAIENMDHRGRVLQVAGIIEDKLERMKHD